MSNYGARSYDGLNFQMKWVSVVSTEALVTFFAEGAPQGYAILNQTNPSYKFSFSDPGEMISVTSTVTLSFSSTSGVDEATLSYAVQYFGQQPGPVDNGTLGTWSASDSQAKKATAGAAASGARK